MSAGMRTLANILLGQTLNPGVQLLETEDLANQLDYQRCSVWV